MGNSLRVIVLSSQPSNSGSNLRARYIACSLSKAGAKVRFINGIKALPCWLDILITAVTNLRIIFIPCDVIIGLKPYPNITIVMMLKRLLGKVTVIDIDDLDFGYRSGFAGKLSHLVQLPFPRHFSLVTYHIDSLRQHIVDEFKVREDRLHQCSQGVDTEIYQPTDISEFRQEFLRLHGLENKKLVVYTAHLNVASDLDAIFEVIKLAREKIPDLHFIVAGGGPMEKHFCRLCAACGLSGSTTFTGLLKPQDVARHLLLGDAAVVYYKDIRVNYYRESMKLREMLALGLKVVCNDVGDLKTFVDYTYQTDTEFASVADMLVRVLTDGGDGRENQGMDFVRREMNWDNIGQRLYERIKMAAGHEPASA